MNNKDFALVHGYFREAGDADGEMVSVPTKKEYNDFRQRVNSTIDMFSKRIEALENGKTDSKKEEPEDRGSDKKYLWRAKSVCVYKMSTLPCEESYSDVKEFTVNEAVSWYMDWVKHLKDFDCCALTYFPGGLFYKKDSEWVSYKENRKQ